MTKFRKLVLITALAYLPGTLLAATVVSDTFDTGIGSWQQNTTDTTVTHSPTGGNPAGYLLTDNTHVTPVRFNVIGAQNTGADYSGVFADGIWNISLDLDFRKGDFTDVWLRFRFHDSSANGWHISIEDSNFYSSLWQSYSVTFDTTWDDAAAMANGWVKETDGTLATPSFSGLWDDVYNSEVRILGGPVMVAGIDNYRASVVPIPTALWLFSSGLLGLIGISRGKNT